MERLTEKIEDRYIARQERLSNGKIVGDKMCLNKLGMLEDLEEQGLLLILPCKVGDIVWIVDRQCENDYYCESLGSCEECPMFEPTMYEVKFDVYMYDYYVKKELFLTKAEAEAKLKELQEKEI